MEINSLQAKLSEKSTTYDKSVEAIEEEFEVKLQQLSNENQIEKNNCFAEINDLQQENSELSSQIENCRREIQQIKANYGGKLEDVENELKVKESELFNLKSYYEDKTSRLNEDFERQKNKLIQTYEENIEKYFLLSVNRLSQGHQISKEKLTKLIQQRELDVRAMMEQADGEEKAHRGSLVDLKNEIEYLNQQIIKCCKII